MIFQPSLPFSPQTTYKVKILPGVKSIYGLDSNQTFETSFTTELQTIKLAVPMDFQDYPLSCEAASLKMALAYKGVYVSKTKLWAILMLIQRQGKIIFRGTLIKVMWRY